MTFTPRQIALWVALSFTGTMIVLLLFGGSWFTLVGLSLALNLYLSWLHYGHDKMLVALGLRNS
jgi:hypothetical protein